MSKSTSDLVKIAAVIGGMTLSAHPKSTSGLVRIWCGSVR